MRDDFCVFILTHGRPDRVWTVETLRKSGYTGRVYLVIDDEDGTGDEYHARYGEQVLTFSKREVAATIDEGMNVDTIATILYARNACFELARQVGCTYFIELDDDYHGFEYTFNSTLDWDYRRIHRLDEVLTAILEYYISIPAITIALGQGGDFIGGGPGVHNIHLRRKAMNSFICSVDRPFQWRGHFNEDVNTYTTLGRMGVLFFTVLQTKLVQTATQSNAGGITEAYRKYGTYVKSFYTVMYCPSAVKVGTMGDPRSDEYRIHHAINWHNVAPKILREEWRKVRKP